jgi:hypothetical protein
MTTRLRRVAINTGEGEGVLTARSLGISFCD